MTRPSVRVTYMERPSQRTDFASPRRLPEERVPRFEPLAVVRVRDVDDRPKSFVTVMLRRRDSNAWGQPQLRSAAVSHDMNVRGLTPIVGAKAEAVPADAQKRWHP